MFQFQYIIQSHCVTDIGFPSLAEELTLSGIAIINRHEISVKYFMVESIKMLVGSRQNFWRYLQWQDLTFNVCTYVCGNQRLHTLCPLYRPHTDTKLYSSCDCSHVHCGSTAAYARRPGHKIPNVLASDIAPQDGVCVCIRWAVNEHADIPTLKFTFIVPPRCWFESILPSDLFF
jgi:hypothetical protein